LALGQLPANRTEGPQAYSIFMLAMIQAYSRVIMLGKWWQVLLVLIALVGIVWLILKVSDKKQPRT
jgi:hypothetical protein